MYIHKRDKTLYSILSSLFLFLQFFTSPSVLLAEHQGTSPIARTLQIADAEVAYGDIVLFDPETNLYRRSDGANDPRVFGVVVENPTLLIETDDNLVPVAESGLLYVNVTLENGAIEKGDAIVTSSTPGVGMRAGDEHSHILGIALEPFDSEEGVSELLVSGEEIVLGTIAVDVGSKKSTFLELLSTSSVSLGFGSDSGKVIARFGFAALVALSSIALTFVAFLSSVRQSVISVGRNPLAKASIRSMVILNIVLALIVTMGGIFFAISLLMVPV